LATVRSLASIRSECLLTLSTVRRLLSSGFFFFYRATQVQRVRIARYLAVFCVVDLLSLCVVCCLF